MTWPSRRKDYVRSAEPGKLRLHLNDCEVRKCCAAAPRSRLLAFEVEAEVEVEAARRAHSTVLERALDELLAESARDEVRRLVEAERARLLREPPSSTPRSALPSEVLEAVERRGSAREADAAMDAEQERRGVQESKGAALEQLVRETARHQGPCRGGGGARTALYWSARWTSCWPTESARDETRALTEAERARQLAAPRPPAVPSEVLPRAPRQRARGRPAMDAEQERRCVEQS